MLEGTCRMERYLNSSGGKSCSFQPLRSGARSSEQSLAHTHAPQNNENSVRFGKRSLHITPAMTFNNFSMFVKHWRQQPVNLAAFTAGSGLAEWVSGESFSATHLPEKTKGRQHSFPVKLSNQRCRRGCCAIAGAMMLFGGMKTCSLPRLKFQSSDAQTIARVKVSRVVLECRGFSGDRKTCHHATAPETITVKPPTTTATCTNCAGSKLSDKCTEQLHPTMRRRNHSARISGVFWPPLYWSVCPGMPWALARPPMTNYDHERIKKAQAGPYRRSRKDPGPLLAPECRIQRTPEGTGAACL